MFFDTSWLESLHVIWRILVFWHHVQTHVFPHLTSWDLSHDTHAHTHTHHTHAHTHTHTTHPHVMRHASCHTYASGMSWRVHPHDTHAHTHTHTHVDKLVHPRVMKHDMRLFTSHVFYQCDQCDMTQDWPETWLIYHSCKYHLTHPCLLTPRS